MFAIEKNEGDLENCLQNQHKFRTDLTADSWKSTGRIRRISRSRCDFYRWNGGNMEHLLQTCVNRLKPNGRIVINLQQLKILAKHEAFKELAFKRRFMHAQISKSKPILDMNRFEPLNPIYIVTANERKE